MFELNETQMERIMEPIKSKYRCTRGYAGAGRDTIEGREGYYIHACDANEAIAYMACRFPGETMFTAHKFSDWLATA